jgi:RimJ/RimL family protein N-acetyltransferase
MSTSLVFRPGKPEDLPAVQDLCKDVWNGYDYMPRVWKRILEEIGTFIFVAETEEGQMAGFYVLQLFAEESNKTGWWRGVRVGTPFRGQGIASRMLAHYMAEGQKRGLEKLRFATAEDNIPMHKVAERYRFRYISPFTYAGSTEHIAPYVATAGLTTRMLNPNELEIAWEFIINSESWRAGEQLFCDSWNWVKLGQPRLEKLLAEDGVTGCFEGEKLAALALFNVEGSDAESSFFVGWMDGSPAALSDLCLYLYQYATGFEVSISNNPLSFMVVYNEMLKELFRRLKFDLAPGEQMRVYELAL